MRAVFLDYATVSFRGDLDPASLQRAMPGLELREHTSQDDVAGAIAGAGIVLLNKLRVPRSTIEGSPGLKLLVLAATGTNNVDLRQQLIDVQPARLARGPGAVGDQHFHAERQVGGARDGPAEDAVPDDAELAAGQFAQRIVEQAELLAALPRAGADQLVVLA